MCLCSPVGLYLISCLNRAVSSASVHGPLRTSCAVSDPEGAGDAMGEVDACRGVLEAGGDDAAAAERRARFLGGMADGGCVAQDLKGVSP